VTFSTFMTSRVCSRGSEADLEGLIGAGVKPMALRKPATPPSFISTMVRTLVAPSATKCSADRIEQLAAEVLTAMIGVDAEALDPAAHVIEAELAGPQVAHHEPHDLAADLGHLRGARIAAGVVR
jgi:hypothetical protein